MARFLASALRHLSGGYNILGSEVSTDQLDLGSVQLVQDVSDVLAAGRGPAVGGWFDLIIRQAVAASLTNEIIFSFLDPFAPAADGFGDEQIVVPDGFDLWLYDVWGSTYNTGGTIDVVACVGSVDFPARLIQGSNISFSNNHVTRRIVARWALSTMMEEGPPEQRALVSDTVFQPFYHSPIFIPQPDAVGSARLRVLSNVTTAAGVTGNLNVAFRLRAVPRGFPPGP